ncbi:cell surface glycoprotein CD200 receptor 1 [Rousettus aegyptiacus]|uniref:CD200 receptor 1 n=2 Tax=Rousettus aegyptiacus TaxID=9407 RepID=A0A7J8HPA3_ROUAE|nr:cell surface glycoprotein CD200 receptor 1 [Rousettus aegyptiacus]KAF6473522.1 CD200 receptor 1 [Rousettus aegyptiacus]
MPCALRTSELQLLLILSVFLVAECISMGVEDSVTVSSSMQIMHEDNCSLASSMDKKQNHLKHPVEVNVSWSVLVNTKVVLPCHHPDLLKAELMTWVIILRDKPPCTRAYRRDKNETLEQNCTDNRITWTFRPEQNFTLQIDPVAITHDGYYGCQIVTTDGNFLLGYHLQVSVAPEVTLFRSKNKTVVCKAIAGKPAAQISWTPEGDCVTEQECLDNGTVTVQSTCHWADSNVSTVFCSVSHWTGNKSQSIELSQGSQMLESISLLYIIFSIFIILVIVGSIWFLKISGCRKCKLKKTEATPVEEDEMQPYASYTEKNNPLYDTTNTVKTPQVLQSEVNEMDLHTL